MLRSDPYALAQLYLPGSMDLPTSLRPKSANNEVYVGASWNDAFYAKCCLEVFFRKQKEWKDLASEEGERVPKNVAEELERRWKRWMSCYRIPTEFANPWEENAAWNVFVPIATGLGVNVWN